MSSSFRIICLLHAAVAIVTGCLMMFFLPETAKYGQGSVVTKILGSTPHDQLLIRTSEALAGMCFVTIGLLLFMISFSKDREFHNFFAKGCVFIHALFVVWRLNFERKVDDSIWTWPRHIIGDVLLAMSWILFLGWTWREKYD